MNIIVDTNVLLHFDFEGADWAEVAGCQVEAVRMTWVNLEELDELKDAHPNARRRDRARRILGLIEKIQSSGSPIKLSDGTLLEFCSLQPQADFEALNLSRSNPDHRLVAIGLRLQESAHAVGLVTHDVTPRIAAGLVGIRAWDMPSRYSLPASQDPQVHEIRRLKAELEKERARRPDLHVDFGEGPILEIEWPRQALRFPDSLIRGVATSIEAKYPDPSKRFKNFDPALIPPEARDEERRISTYLAAVGTWLNSLNQYLQSTVHLQPLRFRVRNDGTAPASDVSLRVSFPVGVQVHTLATVNGPPKPPAPPGDPLRARGTALHGSLRRILPYGTRIAGEAVSPVVASRMCLDRRRQIHQDPSTTVVCDGPRLARIRGRRAVLLSHCCAPCRRTTARDQAGPKRGHRRGPIRSDADCRGGCGTAESS